jgi:hypothetical protein
MAQSEKLERNQEMTLKIQRSIRRQILVTILYECLWAAIFLVLAYILYDVLRIDVLHPYISMEKVPAMEAIGIALVICIVIQIGFIIASKNSMLMTKNVGQIWGKLSGYTMLVTIPVGTFFGLLVIQELKTLKRQEGSDGKTEKKEVDFSQMGLLLCTSGMLMLHQPIIILILNVIMLALPLDMVRPIIRSDIYAPWDILGFVYLAIFFLQVGFGLYTYLIKSKTDTKLNRIGYFFFGLFNIASFPIATGLLCAYLAPNIVSGLIIYLFPFLGCILGMILNPLGLYFGRIFLQTSLLKLK